MKHQNSLSILTLNILLIFVFACQSPSSKVQNPDKEKTISSKDCITRILAADSAFGETRNHACEKISLSQTIQAYTEAMANMDFENCPASFTAAFKKHEEAWLGLIPYTDKYPDLRGEMHVLFKQFENGEDAEVFKPLLKAVWDTWGVIEEIVKTHKD